MEREKRRDTYVHMHRLDHTGPIPLKKGGGKKKKKKANQQSKTTVAMCTS